MTLDNRIGPLIQIAIEHIQVIAVSTVQRLATSATVQGVRAAAPGEGVFTCAAEDPARLNALLDDARGTGALLLELAPCVRDLEEVLAEAIRDGAAP